MNEELLELSLIDSFRNHPFLVQEDESLFELMNSIKENGLINPLIVRKKEDRYELISGHRRKKALELLNIDKARCIIKELTDEEAIIYLVDSNIYRSKLLYSEKAYAYKMRLDAINHQGKKRNFYTVCAEVNFNWKNKQKR